MNPSKADLDYIHCLLKLLKNNKIIVEAVIDQRLAGNNQELIELALKEVDDLDEKIRIFFKAFMAKRTQQLRQNYYPNSENSFWGTMPAEKSDEIQKNFIKRGLSTEYQDDEQINKDEALDLYKF